MSTTTGASDASAPSDTIHTHIATARIPRLRQANLAEDPDDEEHDYNWPDLKAFPLDASLLHGGRRSFSSIALQAFSLGIVLAGCLAGVIWLAYHERRTWRLPSFFATLSVFHFLEFYTTARWNTPAARASSYLLFNNGMAYNTAHGLATLEMIVATFFPQYQTWMVSPWSIALGVALIIIGQVVRSVAMAQAGTNFNHLPVRKRIEGHRLVTTGIYGVFRHPSYFGFFWWAIGTQLMVGNKLCLLGYLVVLWLFFNDRIRVEEKSLIEFFGKEYEDFRARTRTGIPFLR